MPLDHLPTLRKRLCRRAPPQNPPAGRGLTLIEVLIAMFVLSVGLLGVASLLPLGQKKMLEAKIDQQKALVADTGFNSLKTLGGLDPSRWVWLSSTYGTNYFSAVRPATAARIICRVTGSPTTSQIATDAAGLVGVSNYYNNCGLEFRQGKLRGQRSTVTGYTYSTSTATFTTTAFPAAPYTGDTLSADLLGNGRFVPGDTYVDTNGNGTYDPADTFVVLRTRPFALDPLLVASLGTAAGDFAVGMPRLTLSQAGTATTPPQPMSMPAAEMMCLDDSELSWLPSPGGNADPTQIYYSMPTTTSSFNPSIPDSNGSTAWEATLRRQSEGNFSWAATFVPSISGNTEIFNVSVAVFYKRVLAAAGQDGGPVALQVVFTGGGFGGGAALLRATSAGTAQQQADMAQVLPGKWLLISTTDNTDYRWYRVATVGKNFQDTTNSNVWSSYVTLAGSDWNTIAGTTTGTTTTAGTTTGVTGTVSAPVNAMFYPNVVGVFCRAIQIQSLPDGSN